MSVSEDVAMDIIRRIGKNNQEVRYDLSPNGSLHIEGYSISYVPNGSCCAHLISRISMMLGALWLSTFGGVSYMIPISEA